MRCRLTGLQGKYAHIFHPHSLKSKRKISALWIELRKSCFLDLNETCIGKSWRKRGQLL